MGGIRVFDAGSQSWLVWLKQAGRELLDLIYPPRCPGCDRIGTLFCPSCQAQIVPIAHPVCWRCGRPVPRDGLCAACADTPSALDRVVCTAAYAHPLSAAIRRFKYDNIRDLAIPLAARLVDTWQQMRLAADLIAPVPLHPRREAGRGYNQSALLARTLSAGVAVPFTPCLMARSRPTVPQVSLGHDERRQNVRGAFVCRESVAGKSIVVVDDVCTTGATLEACAAALRSCGAAHVIGLTVARAISDPKTGAADRL